MPQLAHFYQQIPGWCDFADFYRQVVGALSDGAHVVEVGVWQGSSTAAMAVEILNSGKAIRLDVVDHFASSPEIDAAGIQPPDQRAAFEAHVAPVRHAIRDVHAEKSWDAARHYADESLDFVFIDAAHDQASVIRDLEAWWPKIKRGGCLAGHDRDWDGVQRALKPWSAKSGVTVVPVSLRSWAAEKPQAIGSLETPAGQRKCLVAVCSNERTIYRQTAQSLINLGWGQRVTDAAAAHGFSDIQFAWISNHTLVSDLRNHAAQVAHGLDASHILFLDADMTWPADVLTRMLAHHDKGIVSGLYHLKTWPHWPVALTHGRIMPKTDAVDYDYHKTIHQEAGLVPVEMVGMGCALVPMVVLQAMRHPWFEYATDQGGVYTVTEDVPFCQKARALGCPILVDPTVACGHIGASVVDSHWYDRSVYEIEMLKARGELELV